jgi:transposase
MPKILRARPATSPTEESRLRKLASSKRAPAEQMLRARTIVLSWDGANTATIAARLGCHPQTVRTRIVRFNEDGLQSVLQPASGGRRPRLTESERLALVAMVEHIRSAQPASARRSRSAADVVSVNGPDGQGARRSTPLTLDSLVREAQGRGIDVHRSQLRRILLASGLQWHPRSTWTARPPGTDRHQVANRSTQANGQRER